MNEQVLPPPREKSVLTRQEFNPRVGQLVLQLIMTVAVVDLWLGQVWPLVVTNFILASVERVWSRRDAQLLEARVTFRLKVGLLVRPVVGDGGHPDWRRGNDGKGVNRCV